MATLPRHDFNLAVTHGLQGEYTRHRRHEELARAVCDLRESGRLRAGQLWHFAYEDGGGRYLPRPREEADIKLALPREVWERKHWLVTSVYGFRPDSFEARATPRVEAFSRSTVRPREAVRQDRRTPGK